MPAILTDEALNYLLDSAGIGLTAEQKAELKSVEAGLAAMKARVRKPRGHMAELAHSFGFTAEDLA